MSLRHDHRKLLASVVLVWIASAALAVLGALLIWIMPDVVRHPGKAGLVWVAAVLLAVTGPIWLGMFWFFEGLMLKRRLELLRQRPATNA